MSHREPTDALILAEGRTESAVDPAVARVEAKIAEDRERVARSVLALRREVRRRTDWRRFVAERPLAVLAGAFAVGLLLGWRSDGRARSGD